MASLDLKDACLNMPFGLLSVTQQGVSLFMNGRSFLLAFGQLSSQLWNLSQQVPLQLLTIIFVLTMDPPYIGQCVVPCQ